MKKYLVWIIELIVWIVVIAIISLTVTIIQAVHTNKQYAYHAFFQDVDGIQKGSPVRLMGVQIGYISDVKLINNTVFMTFIVTKEGLVLPRGCVATTEFFGLGGSKSLEIYPPTSGNTNSKPFIEIKDPMRISTFFKLSNEIANNLINMNNNATNLINEKNMKKYQNFIIKNSDLKEFDEFIDKIDKEEDKLTEKMKALKDRRDGKK